MQQLTIVKIGGNCIDDSAALETFLRDFSAVAGDKILVHGGGKIATQMSERLGIPTTMLDGRRVTDAATLEVVTMVYGGLVNKTIVAQLQARDCNAIGMTGADANIITARQRSTEPVDYGFAGDVESVNTTALLALLEAGLTPVVAPLTHDCEGTLLNTNADTMASALAVALAQYRDVRLIYCFEKRGVLADVNDETSALAQLSRSEYADLKERGVVAKGMIPKLDNAFAALEAGVPAVTIGHAQDILLIIAQEKCGTALRL
jgi:acetylglutamate kinase